jgi:hypothetical protein
MRATRDDDPVMDARVVEACLSGRAIEVLCDLLLGAKRPRIYPGDDKTSEYAHSWKAARDAEAVIYRMTARKLRARLKAVAHKARRHIEPMLLDQRRCGRVTCDEILRFTRMKRRTMADRVSAMSRSAIDVECDFCGELAPVATVKIRPAKAEGRTFHRFTTADICARCARRAVSILKGATP